MESKTLSQRLHVDFPIIFGIIVICGIGLVILYSASNQQTDIIIKQGIRIAIALVLMIMVAQISTTSIRRWSPGLYVFGVVLLILVIFAGDVGKGAQRWLDVGLFRFQPSEIMKLAVPMVVAWYFSERELPPNLVTLIVTLVLVGIPVYLIARQPDLGTALLVTVAGCSVMFIAGIRLKILAGLGILAACCAPLLWYFMHDYQKRRVLTFMDPEQDPLGAGYHIIQSKIAIGSGGMYGKGWLNGTQSNLEFLPERSTDFIFAVYCEEFGFMGVLFLVCVYLLIIFRGLYIAYNAQESFGKLLASGIVLTFFVYIIVNIGMVSGQLPVVGIPLPLISLGGTSMVTLMIGFGILMGIHTNRRLLSQ
ncbi:MAG: rod shape-determining protein RodA [Thiotrichales bacterium]|nr:rod shape-determining protein RodA [Thiotrichales bacterium]